MIAFINVMTSSSKLVITLFTLRTLLMYW